MDEITDKSGKTRREMSFFFPHPDSSVHILEGQKRRVRPHTSSFPSQTLIIKSRRRRSDSRHKHHDVRRPLMPPRRQEPFGDASHPQTFARPCHRPAERYPSDRRVKQTPQITFECRLRYRRIRPAVAPSTSTRVQRAISISVTPPPNITSRLFWPVSKENGLNMPLLLMGM